MHFVRTVAFTLGLCCCVLVSGCRESVDAANAEGHRENTSAAEPVAIEETPSHYSRVHRVSGSPVTAILSLEPAQAKRGGEVLLTVKLDVEPLWEVRALEEHPSAEATRLELELPTTIVTDGEWQAPRATRSIAPDGHSVYVGDAEFSRKLRVEPESKTGEAPVKCRLYYQACNEQQCLAPAEVELAVVVSIQ
jgi:hypothetical protein